MSLIEKLSEIEGLAYKDAIARMCGDEELYASALSISSQQIPQIAAELDSQLASSDMPGFAIGVHGLKGALNTIGACDLADTADGLCKAARAGEKDTVAEGWEPFRKRLADFVEKISVI